jgi:hypothetical protein
MAATLPFGTFRECQPGRWMSALRGKPEVGVGQIEFVFGPIWDMAATL